jgi:hypothetical protein
VNRLESAIVFLVVVHTLAVGAVLLLFPEFAISFGGFEPGPTFFTRQGGAFHLVAGAAYLGEYRRLGTVRLLVGTKIWATIFLGAVWLGGEHAWAVPFSALGDAAMGAIVWWVHRRAAAAPVIGPTAAE